MARPTDWNAIGLDGDPTPGDPDQIRTLSTELNHLGSEARRISTAIDAVMNTAGDSVFVGEAANALRGKVDDRLRGHIEDVAQSFETAATALTTWADKLVDLQQRADGALNSGRGLSEDNPDRDTYASTARQAGTEHSEGASTAAGSIQGVANIQLPISECQIFWEAFQWLAIILIVPALIFGGPIALLALGVNLTLFIKTIVDFASGNASFLDLFLAGLGILAPTTKALPIFQIIKGVATSAFAKGFANIARGTFQALRNLFTNGFRPTTLLLGLKDLVRLGSTWVFKGGLWVLDGIHNLPNIIGHGVSSVGLTIVQGFKAIPGFVRGLPETFSRGWQATKTWVGQEFGGTKWLRIILPVDAAEIGQYGFRNALRIGIFDRGVLGQHVFGAPITGAVGRTISSVPVDPRTVDALVDMPRIQLNEVRFGAGAGQNGLRNLDLNLPSTHLDVTSTLRPPSLNLGDVGAIAHRGNFGVHAARTVDALVDMPHVQLGNVHVGNFGALGGRSEVGVSVGATPTVTTASGLHVPASAGVPSATHGITNTPVTGVSGTAHTTLTGLHSTPTNLTSTADVLLPGGAHNGTHVPGTSILTGTHASPPPVAATLGDLSTPGSPTAGTVHAALTGNPGTIHTPGAPGVGNLHTTLTGTPGTGVAHTALNSTPSPVPGTPHDVTAPGILLTGHTTVAHPSPTGIGHAGPGHVDASVSAFDLLAGGRHNTPNTPVAPGAGGTLAERTTSALHANQTRLHLDELVHSPGSPHPGTPPEQLLHGSPNPTPATPERLTVNSAATTAPDRLTVNPAGPGTPDRLTIGPVGPGTPDRLTISPVNPGTPDRLTISPVNPGTPDRLTIGPVGPATPDRLAANPTPHEPAPATTGGAGHSGSGGPGHSALDLVDTGRSARTTDGPAFAGTPTHTDADKGLAGSANGTSAHGPEDLPAHATPNPPGTHTPLPAHSSPAPATHTADTTGAFDALLKDPNVVKVPGSHELAVKAPRGGTPELHGGAVESGLYTVDKQGTGFVVRQLDAVGGTVVHSWTFKRLGGIRLAEETVRFGDSPFGGVSVKVAGKSVDSVSDGVGAWPAKLNGEDEIVVASTSGSHVYSRSTGELLRSSTPDVTLPPRPVGITGTSADSWDAAAHAARGHMGKAAGDNDVKLFMQGVIGGAFTSKKGYGGFVNPSALEANPGLVGKVKQFNKVAGDLMFEGPNQRMTVWRGVSMDPRAAQADVFVERLPASTSNNRAFQAEWAKNGVNSNRVVFEIDVPADHGKLAMAYPPGYTKAADDALALNQDQWEVTLSPTRLVRTGPARVEADGITVVPVRAEQIPDAQLEGLINEKWTGLHSGEAFEDFGRAFGQDAMRRWEGLGDAIVREGGDGPHVKTFIVSRPGFADQMTITVTHKVDDNAVSVTITGGDRTFTKEWSGTGFNDLAADLRGHVLHNNELLNSLPTPASWGRELPSPVHTGSHMDSRPPLSGATDVHTTPAHAQPQLPHTQLGPDTKAPALTGDGIPSHSLDTNSQAPHHADTDTMPPAPHDLDTKPPAPHSTDTQSPAPHRVNSETAPPPVKESDTTVSHSTDLGASPHRHDAETAPQHLSDTATPHRLTETETETFQSHPLDAGTPPSRLAETDTTTPHLAGTETRTPHLADTDTTPLHPAETDTTTPRLTESDTAATHLDDVHSAAPHRGDNGDFASMPPRDDTRLGAGRSARPLGDSLLDDMLRPPRRTGDTTGTTPPGTAHPAAPDLLDRATFRRNTYRANGIRSHSQIQHVDRALDAFHRVPADQLAQRAEALDNLAGAAQRFLRDRPQSVRRTGVERLLNQAQAEANAYRLLDDFRRFGGGADDLAGRTRTALAAGGTTPQTHTRLQTMLDGMDRAAQAQRQSDALNLLEPAPPVRGGGDTTLPTPARQDRDTTPAAPARQDRGKGRATPARQPGDTPWAADSAQIDDLLGGEGRPFREAWTELSSARQELNRVEDLRSGPGGASSSQGVSAFDVQLNHELVTAQDRFRAAYRNLQDLGVRPTDIETRIREIEAGATRRGATLGAGKHDPLPDTAPPAVNRITLTNSGVSGPNGLTVEHSVAENNAVTLRVLDGQLHPDPGRTVTARPDGGFDVRHTQSDIVTTYTANGDRIADDIPLHGADGRPTGMRLHTDLNGHGRPETVTVNGPGADRLTAFALPGDSTRITHLDTGVTHRVDAQGHRLDEGVQLTGRDGVPAGTDRVRVTDGTDAHVTDLAGNRMDLQVRDLGDGNGVRITDGTSGVSVRHDGRGRLQETGVSLTDPQGARGQRFLAGDGTGRFTVTDAAGARQTETVTALPDGSGFRVTDETTGATTRYTADGRFQDSGLALFDPAANARGDRIAVPDGAGGHRLTDTAGQPLPQRVVEVGGNRPRTIDDVTGDSVLYDAQGRPLSTSTALADPAGGPRGWRFAEPDGVGGHHLTDAHGNRLPGTVTALPDNGGFRTVHDTGHHTFGPGGDFAGDGLRLTGRDGLPAGHLDRPLGAAPRRLDDAFAPDPARAVTFDPAGHIEIARPGGGRQVFDQTTGRFLQETVPLPGGGHRITLADTSFTRYDGQGALTATGTPLPAGHGGRFLVVEPPTAAHPGAWLEDAAGGRLGHWDAVRRPDGTTRIGFNDPTSPRHGEFLHLAADGSPVRQGFNVLDDGRRTDFRYVVDHTTGTWERTTRAGAPTAAASFHHGSADLSGAASGHIRLLSSTKAHVPVFERRVLPGAAGDVVDSFRRTDTISFARTNPRTHWVRWDETGTPAGTGSRHYDTAGTGWRDSDGWGRTVREYRDGLQKFNGRAGHTLGIDDNGAWTWHRYDGAGKEIASGPRTHERVGSGWTDRTAGGDIAQRQWGMAEWPERAGQYQEHAMGADGSLRGTWERHSPHGKEVGKHEVFGDGFLTTDRWREQRPPTWVRTRWLAGAEHTRPPYAHVQADNTYQLFTWTKEANDGTVTASGVRYVGMDGSALDLAADGSFARFSGKLHDGSSLKVGDHSQAPAHQPPPGVTAHAWSESGGRRGYRVQVRNDPDGVLWRDTYQDAGGAPQVAREGRPGGVVREFTGDRTWVDRDPHGNLAGLSHANPDGTAGHVVQGSGRADSGRWTWRELDAQGAEVGSGRREFFRGSGDSRLPWDDSYRDYNAAGQLVRERRMLDSGNHVDAWRDDNGWWTANVYKRDGSALDPNMVNQVRRWWHDGAWQDQWAPGARHFRDSLPGTGQGAPTVVRETPVRGCGPVRVRTYDTRADTTHSVWKEYDHGSVVRERKVDGGGFLESDAWRGQWNRYNDRGDLIAQRTDSGLVFERDSFGRMQLTGNEYDFRGPLTEIRGWGRTTREAQRMPWSGTVLPDGNAALREARYEPYWQTVAKKAALEFGQEFILEFGANLAVNGIVAAVQNKPFTGKDALKSFANAAVGASIKTGLSIAVHENRVLGFSKLGDLKTGLANIDGGKPWTRRPLNHDKTWSNEWAGNETPTRWRAGTYDFSFGVLSSALSGWVNGSMNAAVWGVTNADGQTVKLHGGDAVWEGGINAAASVTTAATTGLVKNVFVMSAGGRLFHRQGFADFWIQLPFKIFEKSIQSLYLTSAYRASINPTYFQAP
ncbi:hypothetical protein ABZ357_11120 [Streptomyces sp. NPDC005917]|uniref:hypothetical protein n=1 Tax=unclassified Streptomyces TaxID=2593676 RepID=UPI0033EE5DC5